MSNLKPEFGLEDVVLWYARIIRIGNYGWPWHLFQCIISDGEPFRQVEGKRLFSVCENVESNLRSFSLEVCNEFFQMSCSVDCVISKTMNKVILSSRI